MTLTDNLLADREEAATEISRRKMKEAHEFKIINDEK